MYEAEINMVIHADGGDISVEIGTENAIKIILADQGPGIPDLELAMQEGILHRFRGRQRAGIRCRNGTDEYQEKL